MWVGPQKRLRAEELILSNCGAGENSWESLGQQGELILKELSPECSLDELMLPLMLQCFGHLMRRADSLEKTLMLGKIEGRRRRGWQRMRWLNGITDSIDLSLSKFWETVKDKDVWHAAVHGVTKNRTWFSNWITTTKQVFLETRAFSSFG